MNLHALVGPAVSAVNPMLTGQFQQSTGATTQADGKRTPSYAAAVPVQCQCQALTFKDLQQLSGLNLNGEKLGIYISGTWEGVSRPAAKGGDLITLPDGSIWLVVQQLENWGRTAGWTKVAVTRQTA